MMSPKFQEALNLAADLHKNQSRRVAPIPYLTHLMSVSASVWKNGGDEEEAIAALLHDVIEDQGHKISIEDIEKKFGKKVADIILNCTDETYETRKSLNWKTRKLNYLEKLKTASASTMLVILCDKIDNAQDIVRDLKLRGAGIWEKFTGKRQGMLWYHDELIKAIGVWLKTYPSKDRPQLQILFEEFQVIIKKFETSVID